MKRRTFLGATGAAGVSMGLVACGNDSETPAAEEVSKDIEATLTLAYWDKNQTPTVEGLLETFKEKFPNVTVQTDIVGFQDYWTKIRTQAEGNNLPDVFWMNGPNIQLYATNDMLAEVTGDVDWANYPEALVELYTVDGTHYGIPKDFDTVGVWCNKAIVEEAGVTLPDGEWTWDEFLAIAGQVRDSLGDRGWTVGGNYLTGGQSTYYGSIGQAGGYVIQDGKSGYDTPETQRGIEFWANMVEDGICAPPTVLSDTSARDLFLSDRLAFHFVGSWEAGALTEYPTPENVWVMPLPQDKERASVIHGLSYAASKGGDNVALALELVRHMTTKEAADLEAANGTAIPAFNGTQQPWVDKHPDWNLQVFIDAAENYGMAYPVSKNTSAWNELENTIITPAIAGERPVVDACNELAEKMNALLEGE